MHIYIFRYIYIRASMFVVLCSRNGSPVQLATPLLSPPLCVGAVCMACAKHANMYAFTYDLYFHAHICMDI